MVDRAVPTVASGLVPAGAPHRRGASWWLPIKSNPSAPLQLICLPYAGGSAANFLPWRGLLEADVDVHALQLPGRGGRLGEPPIGALDELIPQIGAALLPLLAKPIVLFGHSLGALLAFEMCRWMRRHQHAAPLHLFVSGRRAPQIPSVVPITSADGDDAFVAYLAGLNGTPNQVLESTELMQLMLPALRADFRLGENYQYANDERLSCPVTAFGGSDDEESHDGRLDAWAMQTSGSFGRHIFEGDHFFIHSRQQEIVAVIDRRLRALIAAQRH